MAPKPDKYVGLDLTLIEYIKTSAVCTSGIMRLIEMIQTYQNDTNVSR